MQTTAAGFNTVWDLGDEWVRWTGLPFVFAMWVARPGLEASDIENLITGLQQARDSGLVHLDDIAQQEAAKLGLSEAQCVSYLRDNLYFTLGPQRTGGPRVVSPTCGRRSA